MDDSDQMHLMPLPTRVPINCFKIAVIALTLFEKKDREVFECLANLYGFSKNPNERT
jgi:hypothetical protein